jgi:hypothetical protein
MADNVGYTPGSGATIAADDIGGVLYQRVKIIHGADGIAHETSNGNPLPSIQIDPSTATSFGPITTANTVLFAAIDTADERSIVLQLTGNWAGGVKLQASNDGTTYFDVQGVAQASDVVTIDTLNGPDVVVVPVIARWFRAITTGNFVGSVSGSYALRLIDPPPYMQQANIVGIDGAVLLPVAGIDPLGHMRRIAVAPGGGVVPADGTVFQGTRNPATVGPILLIETTGYGSILLQLQGTFTGTITFQVSNDASSWQSAAAWSVGGAAAPVTTATAVGQWVIPSTGRFFRVQITTAGTGIPIAIAVLKNWSAWFPASSPSIAANSTVNVAQIAGTASVTAGVSGMLAVGGNIAEDSAATSNPLICGGIVRTALPAATVIAGDAIRQTFSRSGQVITKQFAAGDLDFLVNTTVTTSTQTALRAAQGADIRQNVTSVTYQNTNATATTLTIQDASTTLITLSVPISMTEPRQLVFPTPLRGTANTALNYTAGTTGANVLLNVTGFNSY